MIRLKNVWFSLCLVALSGCSMKDASHVGLEHLPVVAQPVEVDGQQVTVGDLSLLKDTIDLPLSYWVDELRMVKLDKRDEALVGLGEAFLSENYILVSRVEHIPCKLFRKDGTYVGDVGGIGQGPGEYRMVSDVQIDEAGGYIYLMPRITRSILVYNMQGEYVRDIPLNRKYDDLSVAKGIFKVDAAKNRMTVIAMPFKNLPVVAWVQDMEGNFVREYNPVHLKQEPDYSNDVKPARVSGYFGVHFFTYYEKLDSLYHWDEEKAVLRPKFTMNYTPDKISHHTYRIYYEFPGHYVGAVSRSIQLAPGLFQGSKCSFYMVDKETKQGTYFRLKNNFLDNSEPQYLPEAVGTGYYALNLEPADLMEKLGKALQSEELSEKKRKHLEKILSLVDENDNNYIFYGKLRSDFRHEKAGEALLIYDETQWKK